MRIEIHIYDHSDPATERKLDQILCALKQDEKRDIAMTKQLDDLKAAVREDTTVTAGVIELINRLNAERDDPEALAALVSEISANNAAVAAAIVANTKAAGEPAPTP